MMDPDTLSGSIIVSAPKLSHMSKTFEQHHGRTALTPAQHALLTASLRRAQTDVASLARRVHSVTERATSCQRSSHAPHVQHAQPAVGSSRASR
jgi:uncharacterized protein YlxW (UPF0749 family)